MSNRDTPRAALTPSPETPAASGAGSLRGRRGYGLAAMVAVIGAVAAAVWAVTGYVDQIQRPEEFARTELPGITSVSITQTGTHVVYVEGAEPVSLIAADLTVIGPQGSAVGVRPYSLDLRYDVPGAQGQIGTAVAVFDADRTGNYQVGAEAVAADPTATLAVGDDLAPEVIRAVTIPIVIGVLTILAGIGLALATWIHDERRTQP